MARRYRGDPGGRRNGSKLFIWNVRESPELPVNLRPTAMAAEMRNGSLGGSSANAALGASSGKAGRSGEIAEVIGQEELPLRGASAALETPRRPATEIRVGTAGMQPWGAVVIGCAEQSSDAPVSATHDEQSASKVTSAEPRVLDPTDHKVAITICAVPRLGGRPRGIEKYPFGELTPVTENEQGEMAGPAIFIPFSDSPHKHIANARKRYRDRVFITRTKARGKMIWRQR